MKYRKRPIVVEAVQWFKDGDHPAVKAFAKGHTGLYVTESWQQNYRERGFPYGVDYVIETLQGRMRVSPSDWIITGVRGEVYPVKDDIFRATYESVDDA